MVTSPSAPSARVPFFNPAMRAGLIVINSISFIQETGASEIYLSSGFIDELSADLRARGMRIYSLMKPQQLSLF